MFKSILLCGLLAFAAFSLRAEVAHEQFFTPNTNTNSRTTTNTQYGNQGAYPSNQGGYPSNQGGNQGGYPNNQGGNQGGYPNNQGGYPNNQGGYSNNQQQSPKPGFEAKAGDPFGRDTATKMTCFQAPCFVPSGKCGQGGCWQTVIFVVPTSQGRQAKFVGYDCKQC